MSDEHPSKESLREVKREYKARQKADQRRAKAAEEYWRTESGRPPKGGSGWKAAVAGIALVGIVGGAVYVVVARADSGSTSSLSRPGGSSAASPSADGSSEPAPGTSAPKPPSPFEGTKAASWKTGAAGIAVPKAKQVGIYRKDQVAEAYRDTAEYLEVALLDPRVVWKGTMSPVLDLFYPPNVADMRRDHRRFVATDGEKGWSWTTIANRFHPGDWRRAEEIRVSGRMKAVVAPGGYLEVRFTYATAYWMAPAEGGEPRTVLVRRTGTLGFYGDGPSRVTQAQHLGGWWISTASICGADWPYPDFIEAWTDREAAPVPSPSLPTEAYDPTDPDAPTPDGCWIDGSGFADS